MTSYLPNFLYIHSILRYFILFFALIVVVQSIVGMMGKRKFRPVNKQAALTLLICCDIQLLLGLVLYYFNVMSSGMLNGGDVMSNSYKRFYAVEHSVGMIAAIVLVHIGYSVAKKNIDDDRKFKRLFWCSFIALGIFFAMIPWSSRPGNVGRPNIPHMHS
jgi:hypothetical protein